MTPEATQHLETNEQNLKPGARVRIVALEPGLESAFFISKEMVAHRREGAVGTLYGYVGGHGGDVWWVVHEGTGTYEKDGATCFDKSGIAPYGLSEFEILADIAP